MNGILTVANTSIDQHDRSVEVLQALAHQLRLQICVLLTEGSLSVSAICQQLDTPQHRVSQQLALLRTAGIVTAEKQSRQVFYSIKDDQAKQIINIIVNANKSAADGASSEVKAGQSTSGENKNSAGAKRGSKSFEAGRFSEII